VRERDFVWGKSPGQPENLVWTGARRARGKKSVMVIQRGGSYKKKDRECKTNSNTTHRGREISREKDLIDFIAKQVLSLRETKVVILQTMGTKNPEFFEGGGMKP